jgi:hypothetical protein
MRQHAIATPELVETKGFSATTQQQQALIDLIKVLSLNGPEGTATRLAALFFEEGQPQQTKMYFVLEIKKGDFVELNVLLPLLSGRKALISLYAMQDEHGKTEFLAALTCQGQGAITGINDPEARELLLTLFSLLPDPFVLEDAQLLDPNQAGLSRN